MPYTKLKAGEQLPKSKYKGVMSQLGSGKYIEWVACKMIKGKNKRKCYQSEREAAVGYDKLLIEFGLEPVNILKRQKA